MPLRLEIANASWEELARGIAAAEAVFARSGISIEDAVSGMFAVDLWMIDRFPDLPPPTKAQEVAASTWFEAERAACEACRAGCPADNVGKPRRVLATWPDRQRRYPEIIERLEAATGPDRRLDIDICYVMGWVNEPGTMEKAADLGLPYLTGNLAEVVTITEKSLQGWKIEVDQDPCDARIIELEHEEDYDDRSVAAWRRPDGQLHMEKPPANTAIALTLAAMRLQADSFLPPAW